MMSVLKIDYEKQFFKRIKKIICLADRYLIVDFLFYVLVLSYFFNLFYSKWKIWEDQGIYHYMAWGMQHGMLLYVDLVDNNFPGIVLVHLIARIISGSSPYGLRLVDIIFQFILCFSSSLILSKYKASLLVRILSMSIYLITYFSTGDDQTVQRESFAVPLIVMGLIPWLIFNNLENYFNRVLWFVFGIITALGLWIKPTLILMVVFVIIFSLVVYKENYRLYWQKLSFYLGGICLVSVFFILWLYLIGGLGGFIKWPIEYALFCDGNKQLWNIRFEHTVNIFKRFPYPFYSVIVSLILLLMFPSGYLLVKEIFQILTFQGGGISKTTKVIISSMGILISSLLSILLQGKTFCTYHFIPLHWSLSFLAGAIFSQINLFSIHSSLRVAILIILIMNMKQFAKGSSLSIPPPTCGTIMAESLKLKIDQEETVIVYGFSTTLLSGLERKTPFPYIASWAMYVNSGSKTDHRKIIREDLIKALKNPKVKYLIMEKNFLYLLVDDRFDFGKLNDLGYEKINVDIVCRDNYDFYEHKRSY